MTAERNVIPAILSAVTDRRYSSYCPDPTYSAE